MCKGLPPAARADLENRASACQDSRLSSSRDDHGGDVDAEVVLTVMRMMVVPTVLMKVALTDAWKMTMFGKTNTYC